MENIKVIFEENNLLIFMIVLAAIMGFYILVGNVIKITRDIRKPHGDISKEIKELKITVNTHSTEIDNIREMNRVQCQATKALLNHAIHNGNTSEMEEATEALDKYLMKKI